MALWESRWFDTLGNEIMEEVVSEVDPYKPEDLEFLGHDTPEKRKERMMNLKENMKATTSHVSYGEYPWDPVSLNSGMSACLIGALLGSQAISGANLSRLPYSPLTRSISRPNIILKNEC